MVSPELACPSGRAVTGSSLGAGSDGEPSTPEDWVREHHANELREGDVLRRGEYPAPPRNGELPSSSSGTVGLASYHLFGNEQEGWSQDSYSACEEF